MFSGASILQFDTARPGYLLNWYPETEAPYESGLQALYSRALRRLRTRRLSFRRFARAAVRIEQAASEVGLQGADHRRLSLAELRRRLQIEGLRADLLIELLGHIHHAVHDEYGFALHREQLFCAWALLHGKLPEMATGEGKSITAAVAATVAALCGAPVHVITTNDYLVERDAQSASRLFERFGLSCDFVVPDKTDDERRQAYAADVCYVSNKQLVFDYLRDRRVLGNRPSSLRARVQKLCGAHSEEPLLRGLCFAIVDEADSVFIDDASTPLILSQQVDDESKEAQLRTAIALAERLVEHQDFTVDRGAMRVVLTEDGENHLAGQVQSLEGTWKNRRFRHALVRQALSALHLFHRDCEYLVRDGQVLLIDQSTGRLMPDRKLQQGLHQMVEIKEACELSGQNQVLASLSFQNFFKRYQHLCGMTGTASEAAAEFSRVYGLHVVKVPSHHPSQRTAATPRFAPDDPSHLQLLVERAKACHETGRPVLVGTRSVARSEQIAQALDAAGLSRRVLNARQDEDEALLVRNAGMQGAITIATNMAGRGTDIPLQGEVEALGGLHVIIAELNDNRRVDRQLIGRCARQGDPGSYEYVINITDPVLTRHVSRLGRYILNRSTTFKVPIWCRLCLLVCRRAQLRQERRQRKTRQHVADADVQMHQRLSFTGFKE